MKIAVRIIITLAAILSLLLLTFVFRPRRAAPLELGHSITGRLLARQSHSYHIKLLPQEYVRFSLAQQGGKVTLSLSAQPHYIRLEKNSQAAGKTSISTISDAAVELTVEVRAVTEIPVAYQLAVEEKRPAQAPDRVRVQAERDSAEAEQLYQAGGLQKFQAALEKFQSAVESWDKVGQLTEKADALLKLGNVHYLLGHLEQAVMHLHQSLALYEQTADVRGQVDAHNDLSLVSLQRGARAQAQEACLRALQLSQAGRYEAGQAQALATQGKINNVWENPETSLRLLTEALRIWIKLGDEEKQASTYLEIGASYYYLGQYKNAIDSRSQALQLFQKINDLRGQARALTLLGHLYSTIGDKQEALRHYQLASPLLENAGNRRTEASLANGVAFVYTELGDTSKALSYRAQALALTQLIGDRENESICLMHIGELQQLLGQYAQALGNLQQARTVAQAIKDRRIEAQVLRSLGDVYQALRANQTAMRYYQQAIALYPPTYSSRWKAYAYNNIGELSAQAGNFQQAVTHHQKALAYNLAAKDRFGESQTRYHLARFYRARGNWPDAVAQAEKAVALVESLRAKVFSQELRTSYFASVNQVYGLYIDVLMQQQQARAPDHWAAEALTISERARARSLLELLNDSRQDIKQGADPKLLEQERLLLQTLNGKAERRMQLAGNQEKEPELAILTQELDSLSAQIEELRTRLRATSPRYAALTQPQPLKAHEIQQLLDDNTILLEFALGEARSYVWAVTKDSLEAFTLPPRAMIEQLSGEVYTLLTAPQPQPDDAPHSALFRTQQAKQLYWPKAAELSQLLLAPLAHKLGNKRLLIVSEGALQRIPFAALPMPQGEGGGRKQEKTRLPPASLLPSPLLLAHEIIYLPSASILSVLRQERALQQAAPTRLASFVDSFWGFFGKQQAPLAGTLNTIAILADPVFEKEDRRILGGANNPSATASAQTREVDLSDEKLRLNRLPETALEASAIEKAAGADAFLLKTGFAVNRALLASEELNRYAIVHFATHGYWDSERPELSGLVLSRYDQQGNKQDGFLRLSDIYNLRMPKELVVLSACETALGKDIRGEGLMALTRGFMYAGAARVMASLWKVEEGATLELMKVFYRKLLSEKLSPAAALRAAQLAMWRQDPTSAPYDWAAFVLQGEYR